MTAASYALQKYCAERHAQEQRRTTGNDTSGDPELFHITGDEPAVVWRNTGNGWVEEMDFATRAKAERWVERQEQEQG